MFTTILNIAVSCCLLSISTAIASEVSTDGINFVTATPPVFVTQSGIADIANIVESTISGRLDSTVIQTGFYNRAAIIQFSNNNNATIHQQGRYNRALIVQVYTNDQIAINSNEIMQTGTDAINHRFAYQTSVNDSNPVGYEFSLLTMDDAKTVGRNFIYGPELSRVNVGLLEDISWNFSSLLETKLDQDRLRFYNRKHESTTTPFFAALNYGKASRDSTLGALGYKQNIRSLTMGADFVPNLASRLGISLNLEQSSGSVRNDMGKLETSGYQLGGFGSLSLAQYYLDLVATLGKVDFTSDRFGASLKTHSNVDGWAYTGHLQAGYLFHHDNFSLGPLLAVGYSKGYVDSYRERGNILTAQWIDKQNRERLLASVGATLDNKADISGTVLVSYLKIELEHDFGIGGRSEINSRFAFAPNTSMWTPLDDVAVSNYGKISSGFSLSLNKQVEFSLAGSLIVGTDRFDTQNINGRVAIGF